MDFTLFSDKTHHDIFTLNCVIMSTAFIETVCTADIEVAIWPAFRLYYLKATVYSNLSLFFRYIVVGILFCNHLQNHFDDIWSTENQKIRLVV